MTKENNTDPKCIHRRKLDGRYRCKLDWSYCETLPEDRLNECDCFREDTRT